MKLKKILAAVAAAAVAVSTMAVSAFADNVIDSDIDVGTSWGGTEVASDKFANVAEGDKITVAYTITSDGDYHLVKFTANANNWADLECTQQAVCNNDDPEFKHQDPDFMVVSVDGSVTYTLTAKDAENLKSVGGVVCGYSVKVTSVDVASAAPAAEAAPAASYDVKTVMVMQENATWSNSKSAEVAITGEGEYTYSLTGLSIDPTTTTVLYIKDAACVDETPSGYKSDISDINLEYKSLKINGADVAIKDGAQTAIKDGIFDFPLYNIWADSFIDLPTDTITSVELTVAISAAAAAPVVEEETATAEAPEAEEADEDEDVDVDVDEDEPESEPVAIAETEEAAPVADVAPAVDNTPAPATGNTAVATVVAVMAVAGAAAIVAKKRK